MLSAHLDERQRRLAAAADAKAMGYGGVTRASKISGLSRRAIHKGLKELEGEPLPPGRVRQPGGGRKKISVEHPGVLEDLEAMVDPVTRGDPMSPLRWTCKSTRQLAAALSRRKYEVSHRVIGEMLRELGYSLQANVKTLEGAGHPDRDAQFRYINKQVSHYLKSGHPVISVDTKKKELIGRYRVRQWKAELQRLADGLEMEVTVCHLPPGTSKWNKIEHRLFSHISMNWRGRPLVSHQVVVDLISATTTKKGLRVRATLDKGTYPTRVKISDEHMAQLRLKPHSFHGEWNYTIQPTARKGTKL